MDKLLEKINGPEDLKGLTAAQLRTLAEEVRQYILGSVSRTGGHLASNLGVVEMTVALHKVFDFKKDKLLFDVGHQCYAHKILTGRKEEFKQLRHAGGVSGFPNPPESVYDQFFVGHAGTSIATAVGMALGQNQIKGDDKIVALVGDASVVNGLSFEALNNLGLVKRQLLIVLNDNSMAIDATEGAVAKYFSKIRLSHTYEDLRRTTNNILEHLPVIGKGMEEAVERIKKYIRMALPASQMFESLNIPYFGPVDGHDIESLIHLFTALSQLNHPAILHVYTRKGKGFEPADEMPEKYHSTGPFELNGLESAAPVPGRSFTDAMGEKIVELAEKDERIIAITAAMCEGTGLVEFRKRFPERFYDVGIAESVAVDIAAGLAKTGLKPFVCIYSTFLQRAFDQIFQEVSLNNLNVVFCVDRAGLVGADGRTHHGLMDIGFLRMMPHIVLVSPADETEVKLAMEFAANADKTVVIRYPKDKVPADTFDRSACSEPFRMGKGVYVKRNDDAAIVIVTYGDVLTAGLEAAEKLEKEGIKVSVFNGRFAEPIDDEIVELVRRGKAIITVEDHRSACGFGSAVLEALSATGAFPGKAPIITLGIPSESIKHDTRKQQFMQVGINADKIVETIKKIRI